MPYESFTWFEVPPKSMLTLRSMSDPSIVSARQRYFKNPFLSFNGCSSFFSDIHKVDETEPCCADGSYLFPKNITVIIP